MARFDKYFFLGPPEVIEPLSPATLLLDLYPNALTAYSTSRISSSYTGNLLRVRRSSDNQELDIPYDTNNFLDETVLTNFIGSSDAFVTKWYDQSGNNFDQVQSSILIQPKIAVGGVIIKEGTRPTVFFDGLNDYTTTTRTINVNGLSEFTQSIVTRPMRQTRFSVNIQGAQQAIIETGNWGYIAQAMFKEYLQWRFGTGQINNFNNIAINVNKQCIYSTFKTGTVEENILDNTIYAPVTKLATIANQSLVTELGRVQGEYFHGHLSQAIMWMSSYASVKTDLNDNINSIYASY